MIKKIIRIQVINKYCIKNFTNSNLEQIVFTKEDGLFLNLEMKMKMLILKL